MKLASCVGTLATGAVLAVAALALAPLLSWAVLVAPHAVFIDSRSRTAQVHLINTDSMPEECSIELKFGYPDTDSAGNIFVRLIDDPKGEQAQASAAGWIRAYPRTVVVQPGARQLVRLLAQPPSTLPDGEYWTRLIVTSRGAQVSGSGTDPLVRAGAELVVSTIISVTYRNGAVSTGVALNEFRAAVEHDSLVLRLGLARAGNAAYLGTARVLLRDAAGNVRGLWSTPIAVYYALNRRLALPLDGVLSPGSYVAQLDLTAQRDDIPQSSVLPAAPIRQTVALEVR